MTKQLDLDALQAAAKTAVDAYGACVLVPCDQLDAIIDRLRKAEAALNPRLWTEEMDKAWHTTIPDTMKAFERLREIAAAPDSTPTDSADSEREKG